MCFSPTVLLEFGNSKSDELGSFTGLGSPSLLLLKVFPSFSSILFPSTLFSSMFVTSVLPPVGLSSTFSSTMLYDQKCILLHQNKKKRSERMVFFDLLIDAWVFPCVQGAVTRLFETLFLCVFSNRFQSISPLEHLQD